MVALLQQELSDGRLRRHAGCERIARNAAFERSHVLFEREACGVLCPGVLIAFVLADAFLDEGRSLEDRN